MTEFVASLELVGKTAEGAVIDIVATIRKPYPVEGQQDIEEWACAVSLEPLFSRLHPAHGQGSFQALCLAKNLLLDLLTAFVEKGGSLAYKDGAAFKPELYGFGGKSNT